MLGKHGETLVVDWGLAKIKGQAEPISEGESLVKLSSGSKPGETIPGSAIGTPAYMSPEQAEGRLDQLGPATDIYGLGATLFTLLTGEKPIQANNVLDMLQKTAKGEVRLARSVNPHVPKPLEAICRKSMAVSPGNRYTTCEALAEDLEAYLAGEPVAAYQEPWTDTARRWVRNHRGLATSTATATLLAFVSLVIGIVLVGNHNRELAGLNQTLDERNENLTAALTREQTALAAERQAKEEPKPNATARRR